MHGRGCGIQGFIYSCCQSAVSAACVCGHLPLPCACPCPYSRLSLVLAMMVYCLAEWVIKSKLWQSCCNVAGVHGSPLGHILGISWGSSY